MLCPLRVGALASGVPHGRPCGRSWSPKATPALIAACIGYLKTLRQGFVPQFVDEPAAVNPTLVAASAEPAPPRARLGDFTLTQMKWFLVLDPADLEERERDHLTWLCASHSTLATLYDLVQRFRRLLHQRQGEALDGWIADCQASGIPELAQFATGLLREHDWVVAGITHPASNGPTEGANTKLKLIKRTMYGRPVFLSCATVFSTRSSGWLRSDERCWNPDTSEFLPAPALPAS